MSAYNDTNYSLQKACVMYRSIKALLFILLLVLVSLPTLAQDWNNQNDIVYYTADTWENLDGNVEIEIDNELASVYINVESDVVSVLVEVITQDPSAQIFLIEIADDTSGDILFDVDDMDNSAIRFGFAPFTEESSGELGIFFPGAPQYDLSAGEVVLFFEADSAIQDVNVMLRYGDVNVLQELDMVFYVALEGNELGSEGEQQAFESALRSSVDNLLNPHNLQLGDVRFVIADDASVAEYANLTGEAALEELCGVLSTELGMNRELKVALVDWIDDGNAGGISMNSGPVGTISQAGARFSCVTASWQAYLGSYDEQAANVIHEGSHFMSLTHTTEAEGEFFDLFMDTAECPADTYDTNSDGEVDDFECDVEGGANNFMFYSGVIEFAPFTMSNDQAWVLRRHPLFHVSD